MSLIVKAHEFYPSFIKNFVWSELGIENFNLSVLVGPV